MEWFVCICWFGSSEFVIFLYFCENQYLHIYSEKFFGMSYFDLKVLPMKSSHSQLHFSYIWCIHISHQSKVTCIFLSKSARLITLNPPYHIWKHINLSQNLGQCWSGYISKTCQGRNQTAIELKLIVKTQQLKVRRPPIHEPTLVTNAVRARALQSF